MLISIDADLQDDVGVIPEMIAAYRQGADIVYGVRRSRNSDDPFKRMTALGYYGLSQKLGVNIVLNHADFRLMSRLKYPLIYQTTENTAAVTLFSKNKAWKRSMSAHNVGSGMLGIAS